jgi:hypothetical protein
MSATCRNFYSAMCAVTEKRVRGLFAGAAVLGDAGIGYTVELRNGEQFYVGRVCCKYCARVAALSDLTELCDKGEV